MAIVSSLTGLGTFEAMQRLNADFHLALPLDGPISLREGLEARRRAEETARKMQADRDARADRMRRFEAKLDLEQRLFILEDLVLPECQPPDDSGQPWPRYSLWGWATREVERIRYRLDYEDYEG